MLMSSTHFLDVVLLLRSSSALGGLGPSGG